MKDSLNFISNVSGSLTSIKDFLIVSPQHEGVIAQSEYENNEIIGRKKFLFDFETEQSIDIETRTSDHVAENGMVFQNSASISPTIIKTKGFIGELGTKIDIENESIRILKASARKLTDFTEYGPQFSEDALRLEQKSLIAYRSAQAISEASKIKVDSLSNASVVFTGQGDGDREVKGIQNKQQAAFQMFYQYIQNKTLFTVQTPWAIFKNCIIQKITTTQESGTSDVTSFSLTFKVLRIASVEFESNDEVAFDSKLAENISKIQGTSDKNRGNAVLSEEI